MVVTRRSRRPETLITRTVTGTAQGDQTMRLLRPSANPFRAHRRGAIHRRSRMTGLPDMAGIACIIIM